tara:strand:+ start:346 stop:4968 length:4623 start_codon:yes stop_codon:yes gene_type:complete
MPRVRKYHEGGKGPGYPGHPHPHPYVAVSESTQPHGYTAPVIPGLTDNNPLIQRLDVPREDRLSEFDELKKADWSTILANPMQAWKHISKNGFTRPTQAELDVQGSNIYDGVMSMFNPAAYVEAVKGLDSSLTAADEALLSGIEDGRMSPGDLSKVIGNLSDAGMQALFLTIAPTAGRTLLGAAKELRRPVLNTLNQEFRGSRLLGEIKSVKPVPSSPLQQLTGEKQLAIKPAVEVTPLKVKGKGKKYEPSNPYEESNVAANKFELDPTVYYKNTGVYQYPSFMTGSKLEGQVSAKDGTIARSTLEQLVRNKNTKPSEAIAVEDVLGEFEGKRIPYGNLKQSIALDIRPAEIIKTDKYAETGVGSLGYEIAGGSMDWGTLTNGVTPKTNLYKDKSLGLTKEGESHFPDQPHSFWIRSMSTAEEPNVLKVLEWQTDVKSLKDPSKGLPGSEEAVDYYPKKISGDYFGGDPDAILSLDKQIKIFKDDIAELKNNFGATDLTPGRGYDVYLAQLEKGLKIALDHQKEIIKAPKSAAKGLPLKFVNESLLDAARQGKEYLDVPTAETVFTIEGWTKPNNDELESLSRDQHDILRTYDNSLTRMSEHRLDLLEDLTNEIRSTISINSSLESLINKRTKERGVIYDRLINSVKNNQPVALGTFHNLGHSAGFEDRYLEFRKISLDPDVNSLEIERLGKNLIEYIKASKTSNKTVAKENIIKYKEAQKKMDEIKSKGFDLSKISESEMSVTKTYRNFSKLWRSEFGTDVKQLTDPKGNGWMRVKIPENFFQNDISLPPSEIKTYRKGGKALKGLMKKYGGGGSVGGWGAQGNFSTEYNSKQPKVAEIPDPNSIPEQNALDALVESGEEPLTKEEKKKQKNQKALQGAMKGASMGLSFGPWGAAIGAVAGGALAYFAKQGAKIRKLYKGGGEVSEGKPDVKDLLRTLAATSTKQFDTEPKKPQEDASTNEKLLSLLGSDNYSKEGFQKFREENDIYDEGAIDRVKTWNDVYYSNSDVLRRLTEQYQSTQDEFKGKTMGPHYTVEPNYSFDFTKEEEAVFDAEWKNYLEGIENGGYYKSGRLKPPPPDKYNLPPAELAQALMEYRKKQVGNTHYEATEETWLDGDGKTYGRQDAGRKMDKINRGGGGRQARLIMGLPKDFQERINKVDMARYSPWYESATAHETSHSLDQVQGKTTGITEGEKKGQVDAIASNNLTLDSGNKRDSEYVLSDSELRARVGTLRYNLSKTGDDVFNELSMENIEAIKRSDPNGYKRLSLYLDDESIINLLNTQFKDGGKVKKYAADGIKVPEGKPDVNELLDMLSQHKGAPQKELNQFDSEEKWVPRKEDLYKYLTSRGIDSEGNEIAKTRIIPGPVAEHGEKPSDPASPGISIKDEDGKVKIKVASGDIENPTTRIEESVHSLQQQTLNDTSLSRVGGNKRRLYRMMKKQPWLNDLSPEMKKSLTKDNYVFKGQDSNQEFEAKLIAAKMTMMHEGILSDDGVVSENDLEAIKQWYEKRKTQGKHGWESVLFMDFSDKKYRNEILNTLNKL